MPKSLKLKLQKIRNQKYKPKDFIIADAKDGDLSYGNMQHLGLKEISKGKLFKALKSLKITKKQWRL
jgi:hypothetical protein